MSFITGFQEIPTRYRSSQKDVLDWLADAHVVIGKADRARVLALLTRIRGSADHIDFRGHDLADFTHRAWEQMRLFSPKGSDMTEKITFFTEAVDSVFARLYPEGGAAPEAIVHVTCTGYTAPSSAQKLVASRGWGRQTQVLHAYHMGCYAAHPALRIAAGQMAFSTLSDPRIDIVHTELCSLHFDPNRHDPAQLVIQSLFADGYVKYTLGKAPPSGGASFEIVVLNDEILPDSTETMIWTPGPQLFAMTLSKEVPTLLASALPGFVQRLFEKANLDLAKEKAGAIFAVHPGGPRIIELAEELLALTPSQVAWSRHVLREHGNMSSATLPHIWNKILKDSSVPDGAIIVSLGAGPGLTLSGALLRKR